MSELATRSSTLRRGQPKQIVDSRVEVSVDGSHRRAQQAQSSAGGLLGGIVRAPGLGTWSVRIQHRRGSHLGA